MKGKPEILPRLKQFALRIIRLYSSLPKNVEAQVIGKQFLRSGTSVGAHVSEGRRGRSDAEVISKFKTALQELDETMYWIDLLAASKIVKPERLSSLAQETNELTAILVASVKTIKARDSK